jgi:glycosyltransferase involved in cell wall biosynthesis
MIKNISIVIMAKDAQETIEETLESLKAFPEVILYLNNSSDQTETIAKSYPNVKVVQGEFLGFGKTKNMAASHATNAWVFSLDSEEIIPPALQKEL